MRLASSFTVLALLFSATSAQPPVEVDFSGNAANHQLSWTSALHHNYQVEMSPDLQAWIDTGIAEPGTGSAITYGFASTEDNRFYRIRETLDLYNGGFLVLPTNNLELDLIDGVGFAFNLNVFAALPAKIRIYERDCNNPSDKWTQIGMITDFDQIDSVKFARGSSIWIPPNTGEYDVQATVIDGSGHVIANAVRRVIVGTNAPPSTVITGGPVTPSASPQPATFTTTVTDPDNDEIRRVEFYDNGVLIGTDSESIDPSNPAGPPRFGDSIEDLEGSSYSLLRGTHNITAKTYDSRGAVSELNTPHVVEITGGNARPTIAVTSPASGLIVNQGQSLTIACQAADEDGLSDIAEISAYDIVTAGGSTATTAPFDQLSIDTTGWEPGTHTLRVAAKDIAGASSYPLYLTIFVRTGAGPTFAETLVARIVDETSAAPQNELFTGAEASSGTFDSGTGSGLQIDNGVLLTSGSFALWNGGDDPGSEGITEGDDPLFNDAFELGDTILEDRVAGFNTSDAAILEFDVFCSDSQLEIAYQFGSEEYIEYVFDEAQSDCFNDAFMITIDGVVVSLLPDCSDIVAVNSIHPAIAASESAGCLSVDLPALNEHLFLDDDTDIDSIVTPENQPFQVEYDGMTIRLRIHAFVTPGIHRVRISIADVFTLSPDDNYDSGVFIGEASVRSVKPTP